MSIPIVAIVGRPNVGKSSLFNWLVGRRIAIVDPTAGVTRDRVSSLINLATEAPRPQRFRRGRPLRPVRSSGSANRFIELMDTGGMGIEDMDNLTAEVERQISLAIDRADVLLFVVDGRDGLVPLDEEVDRRLRIIDKPVILVANKCDTTNVDPNTAEFHRLGRGKLVCVSAMQNRGKQELFGLITAQLPKAASGPPPNDPVLKLAIVGRRNTGKSTFINALAQEERMIVSEVAGTTRDSVDVRIERDGQVILAIDTAGVRKKKSLANDIEFYSLARAERSIRRADVVMLFLDANQRVSKVDKQLAEYVFQQHKPAIFVVNKWDLMMPTPTEEMGNYLRRTFPNLDYVPIAFITAKSGKNVQMVVNLAQNLFKQSSARVSTADLNRVLRQALLDNPPPLRQNRRAKIFFATQVAANPPTIVLFTNGPELFDNTYLRYLTKTFRDNLPFQDIAIRLYLRQRKQASEEEGPLEHEEEDVTKEPRRRTRQTKQKDQSGPSERSEKPKTKPGGRPKRSEGTRRPPESEIWRDL